MGGALWSRSGRDVMVPTMMIVSRRLPALFVLAACVVALASAFIAQYVFGLKPCELCLIQRVPFAVAGLLAVYALLPSTSFGAGRMAVMIAAAAFAINAGVAFFHFGVEQHWWLSSCASALNGPVDMSNLAAAMAKPVAARCDEPAWQWHGITMAAMNIPFSAFLAIATLFLGLRMEGRR